jgi:hypothetical protein
LSEIFFAARRAALPNVPRLYTDAEVLGWIRDVVIPESHVIVASADGTPTGFASVRTDGWITSMWLQPRKRAVSGRNCLPAPRKSAPAA